MELLKYHCHNTEIRRESMTIDLQKQVHLTEAHVNVCPERNQHIKQTKAIMAVQGHMKTFLSLELL